MLKMMGWTEGQGLGRSQQGSTHNVQSEINMQRLALGCAVDVSSNEKTPGIGYHAQDNKSKNDAVRFDDLLKSLSKNNEDDLQGDKKSDIKVIRDTRPGKKLKKDKNRQKSCKHTDSSSSASVTKIKHPEKFSPSKAPSKRQIPAHRAKFIRAKLKASSAASGL